jgi:hypothetical protein
MKKCYRRDRESKQSKTKQSKTNHNFNLLKLYQTVSTFGALRAPLLYSVSVLLFTTISATSAVRQ